MNARSHAKVVIDANLQSHMNNEAVSRCLLQWMARPKVSITEHSGQAIAKSSTTGDNVSSRINQE